MAGQCVEPDKACTIEVSSGPGAHFIAADPQGTRVIYALGSFGGIFGKQLFEATIEEAGGQFTVTSLPIAEGVQGVMGASEDATRVYLASTEVLPGSGANSEGDEAVAGQPNLYLHGAGEGFNFVATLDVEDISHGLGGVGHMAAISARPSFRASRVATNGLRAAFVSTVSLTGYANADMQSDEPDGEIYLYDAGANEGAGELICVSCNPSGARPRGREVFNGANGAFALWIAASIPGWISQTHPGNALSANGKRLFFDSYDSLVPGDSNGKADVYQWEAPGEGDCTEARASFSEANGGCVTLITSGESASDSGFLDATPSGSDVFFTTQASLLPWDYGLNDVYDARVNGGLPGPPVPPASCEGEACQGTPEAPNDPTPASAAFQGAGNVKEEARPSKPRCAKGKARKKGRCVPKKQRGGKRAAKHRSSRGQVAR